MGLLRILPLIEASARQWPNAVAFDLQGRTPLRYAALHAHVEATISRLYELGVRPGDRVAVVLPNGPQMAVMFLAIAASGATCAPLNPGLVANELEYYLDDLDAKAVLIERKDAGPTRAVADAKKIQVIHVVSDASASTGVFTLESPSKPANVRSPDAGTASSRSIALLLYTSGTTSKPKLVPLSEANLCASACNVQASLELTGEDRCLNVMPLFHMHGLMAMLASLCAGASVVCPHAFVAPRFVEWLGHYKPTWFTAVPTMHRSILAHASPHKGVVAQSPLRFVRSASAPLPPDLMTDLEDLFGVPVIECFGMTEASNQICSSPLPPRARKPGSVGPAQGTEVAIIDEQGEFLSSGRRGEIIIKGPGVTSGYLNNQEANEKAFWNGWFRTGDIGHLDRDGYLFIAGRIKDIINRGGEKISPREIDEVLLRHPGVDQAVAFAIPHPMLGEDVGAAVVLKKNHSATEREIRAFCAQSLSEFKVPAHIRIVDEIPKGATGKLQRTGLAERLGLAGAQAPAAVPFVVARTATEKRIAEIWRSVLGIAQIGVDDDFFFVGGDSVLAKLVVLHVEKTLGVGPMLQLVEHSTIATMARAVDAVLPAPCLVPPAAEIAPVPATRQLPRIEPNAARGKESFPLIDLQRAYWVAQTAMPGRGGACHLYFERDLVDIDLPRLEIAWQKMVARHEMLRAFATSEGNWQVVEDPPPYRFNVIDLSGHSAADCERVLLEARERMAERSPDFEAWPMFEIRVHRLRDGRMRLHFANNLLLLDFQSWTVLEREWKQVYDDPDVRLPALDLTFRDYALAWLDAENAPVIRRARAYWEQRRHTLPAAPALPQHALMEDAAIRWQHNSLRFEPAIWSAVKEEAARRGLTPSFMTCAAYAEVLAAFAHDAHFTLNVLTQNRHPMHHQVSALVARMSGTLLLEVDFRDTRTFAKRAVRLRDQFLRDYEHRHWTGVAIARSINQENLAQSVHRLRQAPFPVVFASLIGTGAMESVPMGWLGPVKYRCMKTPQVLLDHQTYDDDGALVTRWDFIESAFLPGVTDAMMQAYTELISGLATSPSAWEGPSHAHTKRTRDRQKTFEEPTGSAPQIRVHTLVERQAGESPNRPAVITPDRTLTHAELERCANALAARLRGAGARPDTLVAVAMEKGWEQVVAVLAILKAGAAYLPVDLTLAPPARVRQLLSLGEVTLVVTQSGPAQSVAWPENVDLFIVDDNLLKEEVPRLLPVETPEDLAYVIYTSGSTGTPKGVMIEHGAVVNTILDVNQTSRVGPQDRVLSLSSLGFDLSVWDIFGVLAAGGAVVIPHTSDRLDPGRWASLIREHRVTLWNTVPKMMEIFVEHIHDRQEKLPAHLRLVMMSGDWIPVSLPDRIRAVSRVPPEIISLGGATEASIWSIAYRIGEVDPRWPSIPYGKAMHNQTVHVLDADRREREVRVPGEIYIGGAGLARGYWRDAAKTSASFVPHPSAPGRLYRTGDLGRYLPDGNIEFLGRQDAQVKVRGYRIELGEIEAVLNQHPSVQSSFLMVRGADEGQHVGGDKQIVAYVVPAKRGAPSVADLREHVQALLPDYMVPSLFMLVPFIPLSPNGKVDRLLLPSPEEQAPSRTTVSIPPRDEIERRIADGWSDLLGVSQVGINDNFFLLGGDSVLAVRMLARIRRDFRVDLSPSALFDGGNAGPNVESLARRVRAGKAPVLETLVPIQSTGRRRPLFTVHAVGGTVLSYAKLSLLLPADQPLYGLQSHQQLNDTPETLLAMASRYTREIRKLEPKGPYRLAGWSLGGIIAFEMARQLEAAGERVETLVLIDSFAPRSNRGTTARASSLELVTWFVRDMCGRFDVDLEHSSGDDESLALGRVYEQLQKLALRPLDLSEGDFVGMYARYKHNAWAGRWYEGGTYDGPMTLLCAAEGPPSSFAAHPALTHPEVDDPHLGWERLVSRPIERYVIPGNHYTIFDKPGIEQVAARLGEVLRRADG